MHLPEAALGSRRLCRLRSLQGVRVDLGQGEIAKYEAQLLPELALERTHDVVDRGYRGIHSRRTARE